jgi:hypothetical protein
MASYTTTTDVSAELGGVSISTSSTPTTATVQSWIADASDEVEQLTGRIWGISAVTSDSYEYVDYDGSGRIRLKNYPVVSIESLEYEANGLGATSAAWSSMTEGRISSTDYIIFKDEGIVMLHPSATGKQIPYGHQNVRVTYTYGHTTTPRNIRRLTTLLVAKRYILTVANKSASVEGGSVSVGSIRVSDPTNYVLSHLGRIETEIDYLLEKVVSTFKPHIYDSNLYD